MNLKEYADLTKREKIVVEIYDEPGVHYHEHDFLELSYVLEGSATHTTDSGTAILSKGDYFIIDYHKSHKYAQIGEVPFTVINCLFVPRFIDETLQEYPATTASMAAASAGRTATTAGMAAASAGRTTATAGMATATANMTSHTTGMKSTMAEHSIELADVVNNYLIKFDFCRLKGHPSDFIYHDEDGHIGQLFQNLHREYQQKNMGYLETMRCYLILLLIDIMRQLQLSDRTETANEMVIAITDYVQDHFPERISLSEIAAKYNYSLAHVSHTFKAETGMTFQDYVQSVRIRESCRLLINTPKKVAEIATLVGYTNIKFFNELFKRHMGMSPREFRKNPQPPR